MKKVLVLFLVCSSFLFFSGFGCKNSTKAEKIRKSLPDVTINYWRIFDSPGDFIDIINSYRKDHPNININFRKIRLEEYKQQLVQAWSEDRGPDIFSLPTTWMGEYISKNRLEPMPAKTSMTFEVIKDPKKPNEKDYIKKDVASPTLRDLKTNFVDVVYDDAVKDGKVWGLPLAIDTLVLFYNRDLLNYARIPEPAMTWSQFKEDVKKLTLKDKKNNVIQAGTSMGLVDNVARSFDIVSLLMMQNGSTMSCGDGFCIGGGTGEGNSSPGMDAMIFYTDFANPNSDVYSWNSSIPNSIESFAYGKVVYFLGYSYHKEQIKAMNPSLNYYITSVPQIDGTNKEVNFANYFLEVVANKSKYKNEAWDFIKYETDSKNVVKYLNSTKKPTAIRSLINSQMNDPDIAPFAKQALTAKDWYRGKDYPTAESILNGLVLDVLAKSKSQDTSGMTDLEKATNAKLNMTW